MGEDVGLSSCPNCGYALDTPPPKEKCSLCGKMVSNKLYHLRVDHGIESEEAYRKAVGNS